MRGWVKAAVENSDAFIGQSLLKPMDGVVGEFLKDIGQSLGVGDELVGGLLKPDEKRAVEELFKDGGNV